jgi:tRNA(adenine34) deaminase
MGLALAAAEHAGAAGDVPIGAIAVRGGVAVSQSWNEKEARPDPTGHAEILAIRAAAAALGRWRLPDITLYVTLEPCAMCAGAMVQARIGRLVFGATDPRAGAAGSAFALLDAPAHNHVVPVTPGVRGVEAQRVIDDFMRALRARPKLG